MDKSGRVTLSDIAKETGFTINTVSRALKNKSDISVATREKIQNTAKRMGYVRNALASSLRSGRTRTIAVILGEMSNPYYALMADEIQRVASERNYSIIILCSRECAETELKAAQTAVSHQVDGVLLLPCQDYHQTERFLYESGIPCILMSRYSGESFFDTAVCDEKNGAYMAANHLFQAGCKKIAMLSRRYIPYASEMRTAGFLQACKEHGMEPSERYVCTLSQQNQLIEQINLWKREQITGVFCFCDYEAWELISVLHEMGLSVPNDFSVIGFDDIQKTYSFPYPICSVGFDVSQMTTEAVDLLIRRIHGEKSPRKSLVYPVSLSCRNSCCNQK